MPRRMWMAPALGLVALLALGCSERPRPTESSAVKPAVSAPPLPSAAPPVIPAAPVARPQLDGRAFPDKVLALTWDDGPDVHSLELGRYLHAQHVAATFFVVADWVDGLSSDPGAGAGVFATGYTRLPVLAELVALGHRLGNHTLNHVLLGDADAATVVHQLRDNQARLDPFQGGRMGFFRVPGGAWSASSTAAVEADPVTRSLVGPVRWDVDAKDWEGSLYCRSERPLVECEPAAPERAARVKPAVMARRYLASIEAAGHGIVLLHDRVGHVGSRYALDVAERLVPALIARGYVFAAPVLRFSPLAARPGAVLPAEDQVAPSEAARRALDGAGVEGAVQLGDLNGDGRADVCGRTRDGVVCALSTGPAFARPTLWLGAEEIDAAGWPAAGEGATFRLRDVNGDGRADACGLGPGGVVCGLAP